jgi:flagellar biosynthesis/type III secretory pathway chaperone
MSDVTQLSRYLQDHLQLCREILRVVEAENRALRESPNTEHSQLTETRQKLLPRLDASLAQLRVVRHAWQQLSPEEREQHPSMPGLLQENQDLIMKILMIDRENEQCLLRLGRVPAKHLPSVERQRPHFVADLYRRSDRLR